MLSMSILILKQQTILELSMLNKEDCIQRRKRKRGTLVIEQKSKWIMMNQVLNTWFKVKDRRLMLVMELSYKMLRQKRMMFICLKSLHNFETKIFTNNQEVSSKAAEWILRRWDRDLLIRLMEEWHIKPRTVRRR